mmetsp:Transcript_37909/g.93162  ORF Transcript_37909/g.93162 Transcript_37909/m.93162 type:complete len:162 (+) Transcript_37909:45-530(+)
MAAAQPGAARGAIVLAILAALLAACQARPPPDATTTLFSGEAGGEGRRQEAGSVPAQTYYVLLDRARGPKSNAEAKALADTWWEKLGKNSRLRISAASRAKLVVAVRGGDDFQNQMVTALRSFPETRFIEKRPIYVPLGRGGRLSGMPPGLGAERPHIADI